MGPRSTARWLTALLLAVVAAFVTLRLPELDLLRRMELLTLDARFRLRGPLPPGPNVALLTIDDRSVAAAGGWPVSRALLAETVRRLDEAGATVIALDLLLTESGVPAGILRGLERARDRLPRNNDDRAMIEAALRAADAGGGLAAAIATARRVVLPYSFSATAREANAIDLPEAVRASAYAVVTGAPVAGPPSAGLIVPQAELIGDAGLGHVGLLLDVDGALRFDRPAHAVGDRAFPSFAIEAARMFRRLPRDAVALVGDERIELGPLEVVLDTRGHLLVNYYGPRATIATLSLEDLLDGSLRPERVAGRVVVVGATATGAGDRFATPFDQQLPGAEFLATTIDNILTRRALVRDARVVAVDLVAATLLAVLGAWIAGRGSLARSGAVAVVLATAWTGVVWTAFTQAHVWLGMVAPTAAGLGACGAVEAMRVAALQRRRRRLEAQRSNLQRYFPPAVVDRLAERKTLLEGTCEAAVMFVDLKGFTGRAETMSPAAAMNLLRAFHAKVEAAVFQHGGMLDKFIGDGALACFGVPEPSGTACFDALRAAETLVRETRTLSRELEARGQPPLEVSIGIHHGPVLMGDIGNRQLQFTVVGDTVNTAARIEAMTREHLTTILVSEPVIVRARELADRFEPVADVAIRGREGTVRLWRLRRG